MAAVESFSKWLWWLKVSEALNYYDQVKTKLLKYDLVNWTHATGKSDQQRWKKNLSSKARHVALSTFFSGYIFESSASSGFTGEQMSSVTLAAASNSSPKWTPVERKSRDLLKLSTKVRGKLQDDVHMGSSCYCGRLFSLARAAALTIRCSTGTGSRVTWLAWWGAPLALARPASRHERSLDLRGDKLASETLDLGQSVQSGEAFWFQGGSIRDAHVFFGLFESFCPQNKSCMSESTIKDPLLHRRNWINLLQ